MSPFDTTIICISCKEVYCVKIERSQEVYLRVSQRGILLAKDAPLFLRNERQANGKTGEVPIWLDLILSRSRPRS
jgi:hypothetical protein